MRIELSIELIDKIIKILESENRQIKQKFEEEKDKYYLFYLFLCEKHPELIREFVEFAYAQDHESACLAVRAFHNDMVDLSKIPCAQKDFEPWA